MAEVTKLKGSRRAQGIHANRLIAKQILKMNFKLLNLKHSKKITNTSFRKYKRLMMILYLTLRRMQLRRNIFYTVLKKVELCLNKVVMETASLNTPALPSTSSSTKESDLKVKLPKTELSKFSGQVLKWQTFWDQFKYAIHSKESLCDIDKFKYLKGC